MSTAIIAAVAGIGSLIAIAFAVGYELALHECAPDGVRADRYKIAVDNLDKWCGHEFPEARLIAAQITAVGEGLGLNAGTPSGNEPCTISGLREQLRRLAANRE